MTATITTDSKRIAELRTHLASKAADLEGMAAEFKTEGEGDNLKFAIPTDKYTAYMSLVEQAKQIEGLIAAEEVKGRISSWLDAPETTPIAGADAAAAARLAAAGQVSTKSLADLFLASDQYKRMKDERYERGGRFVIEGRGLDTFTGFPVTGAKDVFGMSAGTVDNVPGLGTTQQVPLVERQRRPGRIRDLYPAGTTQATMLFGVRETGWTNNAAVVSQRRAADEVSAPTGGPTDVFGKKPKSTITMDVVNYPIATIAHLLDVHKLVLDDEPRLRAILDRDMIDGVKMVEDYELLYGVGGGDRVTGLVNTPGIQLYSQTANPTDKKSGAVRRAATRVMLAFYQPTGLVVHPLDFEDLELETDDMGQYRVAVSVAIGAQKQLWRLDVVETPAIDEGKFLVGAFGSGSRIWDREEVAVTVSTENRDNYERNVVTLRAEERLGFEVPRPESHCYGTFS